VVAHCSGISQRCMLLGLVLRPTSVGEDAPHLLLRRMSQVLAHNVESGVYRQGRSKGNRTPQRNRESTHEA
jgi:hypothetical protein